MQVALALFPGITALDIVGPYEVIQRVPSLEPVFVGEQRGPVRAETTGLGLIVDATFDEVPAPDVIVVPGGFGTRAFMNGGAIVDWVAAAHPTTTFTTPSGIPASRASPASRLAESGVSSAGFRTTVLPHARAGPSFHEAMLSGKFQGTIAATTPRGSRKVMATPPPTGIVSP